MARKERICSCGFKSDWPAAWTQHDRACEGHEIHEGVGVVPDRRDAEPDEACEDCGATTGLRPMWSHELGETRTVCEDCAEGPDYCDPELLEGGEVAASAEATGALDDEPPCETRTDAQCSSEPCDPCVLGDHYKEPIAHSHLFELIDVRLELVINRLVYGQFEESERIVDDLDRIRELVRAVAP